MSHHRIIKCQHCGKETEDCENEHTRWERGCDVCGKRAPEWFREGTMSQIQLQRNDGSRASIDACNDCVASGGAVKKLAAIIAKIKEQ